MYLKRIQNQSKILKIQHIKQLQNQPNANIKNVEKFQKQKDQK